MKKIFRLLIASCIFISVIFMTSAVGVSAADGPAEGEDATAYIFTERTVIGSTEWGGKRYSNNYVYMSDYMKKQYENNEYDEYTNNIPKGMSYNKEKNTLTLDNYTGKEISCNMMGDDFKIELKGENHLEMLYIWSNGYGGSLTIFGEGTLVISGGTFFEENDLYGRSGLRIFGEAKGTKDSLVIKEGATVIVEGNGEYDYPLIAVYQTSEQENGIVFEGVEQKGGLYSTFSIETVKTVDHKDLFFCKKVKKNNIEFLQKSVYDYSSSPGRIVSIKIYTDSYKPVLVDKFTNEDEMIAAGYEYATRLDYDYRIIGKSCIISSDTDLEIEKGDILTKGKLYYGVIKPGSEDSKGQVEVAGIIDSSENMVVTIPNNIKINGIKYKVTGIAENAFYFNYNIEKVIIGIYVKNIGKNAFTNCQNLKEIVIKSKKLTSSSVKKGSFTDTPGNMTVYVPSEKKKEYRKILRARGVSKSVLFEVIE